MATNCKQLNVGNEAEKEVAEFFKKKGYWAYITPKKFNGQPVDIIAGKDNILWLVDAKHLRKQDKSFDFSRIESNQRSTMKYAKEYANNQNVGFCVCWENCPEKIFFLHYDKLIEIEEKGRKSAKFEEMEDFECVLK
jgi:Holliday junction resolvase-like predicted endonuclease